MDSMGGGAIRGGLLVVGLLLSACSGSVLVRDDDPAFSDAQERLARTARAVDALAPPPAERVLFLQAEGFYRYRFTPPPRSTGSYAAEAAASITDFPAFQALAGAMDLADLRTRAPDSAVQLWETLLQRYPQSSLRPLTLYRLGWAYRSVGASGLPRKSPDEAFDLLIREQPGSVLAGSAREAKTVEWKSKGVAAERSLVPGLGQMYLGETRSGWTRLGIAALSAAAFAVPAYEAAYGKGGLTWRSDWPLLTMGLAGLVVLSFDYTTSYQDAMAGVLRWNERAELSFEREHPAAP